jgi:hypothetical protein
MSCCHGYKITVITLNIYYEQFHQVISINGINCQWHVLDLSAYNQLHVIMLSNCVREKNVVKFSLLPEIVLMTLYLVVTCNSMNVHIQSGMTYKIKKSAGCHFPLAHVYFEPMLKLSICNWCTMWSNYNNGFHLVFPIYIPCCLFCQTLKMCFSISCIFWNS